MCDYSKQLAIREYILTEFFFTSLLNTGTMALGHGNLLPVKSFTLDALVATEYRISLTLHIHVWNVSHNGKVMRGHLPLDMHLVHVDINRKGGEEDSKGMSTLLLQHS